MKLFFISFLCGLFTIVSLTQTTCLAQTQGSTFKESAVYYRLPTYQGTDTQEKFLGDVVITIVQEKNGFRLSAINDQVVKMDPSPGIDLNDNQTGQVRENPYSNSKKYMYNAHWRKNGISYIVFFNSVRIRDYYISH